MVRTHLDTAAVDNAAGSVVVPDDLDPRIADKIVALAEFEVVVDLVGRHLFVVALLEVVAALDLDHLLAIQVDFQGQVDLEASFGLVERWVLRAVVPDRLLKREAVDFGDLQVRRVVALAVLAECFVRVRVVGSVDSIVVAKYEEAKHHRNIK